MYLGPDCILNHRQSFDKRGWTEHLLHARPWGFRGGREGLCSGGGDRPWGGQTRQPHGPMGEGVDHEFPGGRGTWRSFLAEVQELISLCAYGKRLGSGESLCEGSAGETSQCSQEGLGFLGLESPGWRPRSGHQGKAFLAAPGAEVGMGTVGRRGWNRGACSAAAGRCRLSGLPVQPDQLLSSPKPPLRQKDQRAVALYSLISAPCPCPGPSLAAH